MCVAIIMADPVLKMEHPIPVRRSTGQARAPFLPNDKRNTKGFDFSKSRFQQKML